MRNLKRALSLALASVMLLGMMVVGASAASYPDVSAEDNVEAIEVLNAVKVMVGDRGNFRPEDGVNRHEMAVIMAKLYLGSDEADNYVGSHPFTDVVPWADKYVAACYENNLISGTSKTTYGGNQPLKAVEAAAMMLRALGYEDLSRKADDWRVPVTAKANEIRLFKGVVSSPSAQLTRNDVAQLALNTLEADVVVADIEKDIIVEGIVTIPGKITYNKVEDKQGLDYDGEDDKTLQLCEKLYDGDLKLDDASDNYGRPGKVWKYKTNDPIAYRSDSPILTYTGKAKTADVEKDLKGYSVSSQNLTIDGTDDSTNAGSINALATAINGKSGKGVTVTVYANDAKVVTNVVVINTYIGQVTKVKTEKDETTVTVSKKAGGPESDNTFETDAFEKDDYVIYTVGSDGIETMELAKKVTGKVTATSSDYLRLDGTKYEFAKTGLIAHKDGTPAVKDEFDLYLAADGSVVYTAKVEGAATEYLYVKGADKYFETISINAVFSDGTTKVVTVDGDTKITSDQVVASGGTKLSDSSVNKATVADNLEEEVYSYTESDGKVKLTSAPLTKIVAGNGTSTDHVKDINIKKGDAALYYYKQCTTAGTNSGGAVSGDAWGSETGASVVANNSTVYVMVSSGKTYTGFRDVPSLNDVSLVYVLNEDNASLVDLVFIIDSEDGDSEDTFYFYIKDSSKFEQGDGFIQWNEAYVDGEKAEGFKTTTGVKGDSANQINAAGIYKATKSNDKGYVSEVKDILDKSAITGVQAEVASGNTLKLTAANIDGTNNNAGTLSGYTYNDETVFVTIDKDGDVSVNSGEPGSIEKKAHPEVGDSIYYVFVAEVKGASGNDAKLAKTVYAVEAAAAAAAAPTTVTLAAGAGSDKVTAAPSAATANGASGAITGVTDGSANKVKLTITKASNTSITVVVVGGTEAASPNYGTGAEIAVTIGTNLVVTVTVEDDITGVQTDYIYTWTVAS